MVEECRKGDKEALNLFYLRFAPRMLSVIHRYIRDEKDAEDVLHDGFIVGLTRLDSLRDTEKVEIWLATIMKNLSLQYLQAQDMATILSDIPEVEDTPEIDDILDLETLESLIEKLPSGYQKVFRLAILENKSHKEIGELLGIAPNSSSSQLFHAKLMMRKLIKDYWLQSGIGCLLLLGLLTSLFIRNHHNSDESQQEILLSDVIDDEPEAASGQSLSFDEEVPPKTIAKANKVLIVTSRSKSQEDNHTLFEEDCPVTADSIVSVEIPPQEMEENDFAYVDDHDVIGDPIVKTKSRNGWSLNVGADLGLLNLNMFGDDDLYDLASPPPDNPDDKEDIRPMAKSVGDYKDYRNVSHTNFLPITVAISASKSINSIFSVETGLKYTYLHSTFETTVSQAQCHWHYVGIPLKLNAQLYSAHKLKLYTGVGGAVDIPLYSGADVTTTASTPDLCPGRFSSPVMWSLSVNLGVSLKMSKKVDIFIEPTLQYHFVQDYTVPNIWIDDRRVFSLPIGFRFNF